MKKAEKEAWKSWRKAFGKAFHVLTLSIVPALAGYGIFWWYRMPFGIGPVHVGISVMVACYISSVISHTMSR